jgi:hypothetical protein
MRANLEKKSGVSSVLLAGELLHILEGSESSLFWLRISEPSTECRFSTDHFR